MWKEKNLELKPLLSVQKAIIEELYIPIRFQGKVTLNIEPDLEHKEDSKDVKTTIIETIITPTPNLHDV